MWVRAVRPTREGRIDARGPANFPTNGRGKHRPETRAEGCGWRPSPGFYGGSGGGVCENRRPVRWRYGTTFMCAPRYLALRHVGRTVTVSDVHCKWPLLLLFRSPRSVSRFNTIINPRVTEIPSSPRTDTHQSRSPSVASCFTSCSRRVPRLFVRLNFIRNPWT